MQGLQGQQVQPEDLHPLQGKPQAQTTPTLQHYQTTHLTTPNPPATATHPARVAQNSYLRRTVIADALNDPHTQSQSYTIIHDTTFSVCWKREISAPARRSQCNLWMCKCSASSRRNLRCF